MAIGDGDFRVYEKDGIRLARDRYSHARILDIARDVLSRTRLGTEDKDHLSDDIYCQRKQLLRRRAKLELIAEGKDPAGELSGKLIVFFIFGHAMQRMLLGEQSEVPIWSEAAQHWYSPDGADVVGDGVLNEVKTTRRWPTTKASREAGMSVEDVLATANPAWFEYILGVMWHTGAREYLLTVVWVVGADIETFKIEASDEAVQRNWDMLTKRRDERRSHEAADTLPGIEWRMGDWECKSCDFRDVEPCLTEVPGWKGG